MLLYLPTASFEFTKTVYQASYDAVNKTVTVGKNPITFTRKAEGVAITVDDSKYLINWKIFEWIRDNKKKASGNSST